MSARISPPGCAPSRVLFVVFDGFQILDVTGPAAAFEGATRALAHNGEAGYRVELVSDSGGLVASSAGLTVSTRSLHGLRIQAMDTVLVAGADEPALRNAIGTPSLVRFMTRVADRALRYGSVCSGAFVLGAAGLLTGRRVATHWAGCAQLAQLFPDARVDDARHLLRGRTTMDVGRRDGGHRLGARHD